MRHLLLTLLLLPLAALGQDGLYGRFASRSDLAVAQVTGLGVNDSVRVDVVLLVADDEAAWRQLKEAFDIRTSEGVTSWMGDIEHPERRVRRATRPAWRAVAVHAQRTLAFYRVEDDRQYQALLDSQTREMEH